MAAFVIILLFFVFLFMIRMASFNRIKRHYHYNGPYGLILKFPKKPTEAPSKTDCKIDSSKNNSSDGIDEDFKKPD